MFFTPELLSRRDSGFGLLWLAATLGAKSSFRKLPKRSVLTADIEQLCNLIAEPEEPLALRLTSNLMVGVARVYKVKHEMFLTDVTACFNSLKKAITELNMATNAQFQMAQSSMKVQVLTLDADPTRALAANFANMFMDWDDIADTVDKPGDRDDEDFDPKNGKSKAKKKPKSVIVPSSENPRVNQHTLNEDLSHLLSTSFDTSFSEGNAGGAGFDTSQGNDMFGFEDDVFGAPHDLDLAGDIGEELARELGEGWGANNFTDQMDIDQPMTFGDDFSVNIDVGGGVLSDHNLPDDGTHSDNNRSPSKQRRLSDSDKEYRDPSEIELRTNSLRQASTAPPDPVLPVKYTAKNRRKKDGGLMFDEVTELTAEELKESRAQYMERQNALRYELETKKRERGYAQIVEQMLWAIPHDIMAPEIIEFWRKNLKIQMDARIGVIFIDADEPPKKRRKTKDATVTEHELDRFDGSRIYPNVDQNMDAGVDFENDIGNDDMADIGSMRLRSSEEPGQGRNISRPPSAIGSHLEVHLRNVDNSVVGSQKNALFPWDNAGASSSTGLGYNFLDGISGEKAGVRLARRSSPSESRRESSVLRSLGASPAQFGGMNSRLSVDDFEFPVPGEKSFVETQTQTQQEASLQTMERNSYNFLEYSRMQLQTIPSGKTLTFEDVTPTATSTRHVAAAAFYNCLVLATKNLVGLRQDRAYDSLEIRIK